MAQAVNEKMMKDTKRRIKHAKSKLKDIKGRHERFKSNGSVITEHGGWDRGYWEGRLSALEDVLDDLNDSTKSQEMGNES